MRLFKSMLVPVVLVAVGVGAATTMGSPDDAHSPDSRIGPEAQNAISVLRSEATSEDRFPSEAHGSPLFGSLESRMVPGTFRRVQANGTTPVWIMPGRDQRGASDICIAIPGAVTCPTLEQLRRDGAAFGAYRAGGGPLTAFGVVIDGVSEVSIRSADGSAAPVMPRENAFVAHLDAPPVALEVVHADGSRQDVRLGAEPR